MFMAISLTVVCVLQCRAIDIEKHGLSKTMAERFLHLDRKFELVSLRWTSMMESLQGNQRELMAFVEAKWFERFGVTAIEGAIHSEVEQVASGEMPPKVVDCNLPPIPEGISPESTVSRELSEILANEKLNPTKRKKLSSIDGAEALLELARVQSALRVLDSEILFETARGMEVLRQKGAYIEYAPGERYEVLEGVKTAAEVEEEITRMFYFYPEQFPGIYERIGLKANTAETSLRKLLSIFQRKQ